MKTLLIIVLIIAIICDIIRIRQYVQTRKSFEEKLDQMIANRVTTLMIQFCDDYDWEIDYNFVSELNTYLSDNWREEDERQ